MKIEDKPNDWNFKFKSIILENNQKVTKFIAEHTLSWLKEPHFKIREN